MTKSESKRQAELHRLKPRRAELKQSLEKLAELAGVTPSYLAQLEAGAKQLPKKAVRIVRLARAYQMPIRELASIAHGTDDASWLSLSYADLSGLDIAGLDLSGLNLRGTDFSVSNLSNSNLAETNLRGADLSFADLSGSRLAGADLSGANLSHGNLVGADLSGTIIDHHTRFDAAKLVNAKIDVGTFERHPPIGAAWNDAQLRESTIYASIRSRKVSCVAFSPDGSHLVSAHHDGTVRIWSVRGTSEVCRLTLNSSRIKYVHWSTASTIEILILTSAGRLLIWKPLQPSEAKKSLRASKVSAAARSPLGELIAAVDQPERDGDIATFTLTFWRRSSVDHDMSEWSAVKFNLKIPASETHAHVSCLALRPKENSFEVAFACGSDVYRVEEARPEAEFANPTLIRPHNRKKNKYVNAVSWDSDGSRVLSVGDDNRLYINSLSATEPSSRLMVECHAQRALSAAWSPDGSLVATGGDDSSIVVWAAAGGTPRAFAADHRSWVECVAWTGSAETEEFIASGTADGTIHLHRVIRAENGSTALKQAGVFRGLGQNIWDVAWAPGGRRLAVTSDDPIIRIWSIPECSEYKTLIRPEPHRASSLAWNRDGKYLAAGYDDGVVVIWDVISGEKFRESVPYEAAGFWCIAWNPKDDLIASGSADGQVRLYDSKTAHRVSSFQFVEGEDVRALTWSPDGRHLAVGGDADCITWVPIERDERGVRFASDRPEWGPKRRVRALAWPADSEKSPISGHESPDPVPLADTLTRVNSIAYSSLQLLARGYTDGIVTIEDRRGVAKGASGIPIPLTMPFGRDVEFSRCEINVAWSDDGALLATGSADGSVRIWRYVESEASLPWVATLIARGSEWAAFGEFGRYKHSNQPPGLVWLAAALCRFNPGELQSPFFQQIPAGEPADEPIFTLLPMNGAKP